MARSKFCGTQPDVQKHSPDFWKAHVKAWQGSGLNRAEYCRRHSLSYDALTYWHNKTKEAGNITEACSIVPVFSVQHGAPSRRSPIILRLHQATIEIEGDFDETALKKLIRILEGG